MCPVTSGAAFTGHDPGNAPLEVIAVRMMAERVGSTLLMHLLASSPAVTVDRSAPVSYEHPLLGYLVHLFTPMGGPAPGPGDEWWMEDLLFGPAGSCGPLPFDPECADRVTLQRACLRSAWSAVEHALRCHAPQARFYAEKSLRPLDLAVDAGVPVRLVDLVRDPRDIAASHTSFFSDRGPFEGASLDRFVAEVQARLVDMHRAIAPRLVVRYEDLVREPARQAARLSTWLGTRFDAGVVEGDRAVFEPLTTTPSGAASIGRWRRDLPRGVPERIWVALGDQLAPFGYDESGAR